MMKKKLSAHTWERKFWWKLAMSYFLLTLGSLFLVIVYLLISLGPHANMLREEMTRRKTEQLTRLLAENMGSGEEKIELQNMLEFFSGPLDPQIWILDRRGNILMESPKAQNSAQEPRREAVEKALREEKAFSGIAPLERISYTARPIVHKGETIGVIYVNTPLFIPAQYRLKALVPLLKAFALIAFLSLFVSAWMARKVIRPLEEMTTTARRLGEGELGARVKERFYTEEMEILGETLNTMAQKLQSSMDTLEQDKRQLQHMEGMRRDLVASISHEIRTPLSTIQGYSEALQDGVVTGADAAHYIDVIHREVNHLNRLITDLLELEKLEAKAVELCRESFSVKGLLEEIVEKRKFELARTEIAAGFAGEDIQIYADKDRIQQVLANLLENSLRYCPAKAKITVSARKEEAGNTILFEDNGPGVSAEDLARLCEHFYRVEKSRSKSRGGYGLGLAIVKNIVELHGGAVEIENGEGGGLRFMISLPHAEAKKRNSSP